MLNNLNNILREEKIRIKPEKINLLLSSKLLENSDINLVLRQTAENYFDIELNGNYLINGKTHSVTGLKNAEQAYEEIKDNLKKGDYTAKTNCEIIITPKYIQEKF